MVRSLIASDPSCTGNIVSGSTTVSGSGSRQLQVEAGSVLRQGRALQVEGGEVAVTSTTFSHHGRGAIYVVSSILSIPMTTYWLRIFPKCLHQWS